MPKYFNAKSDNTRRRGSDNCTAGLHLISIEFDQSKNMLLFVNWKY